MNRKRNFPSATFSSTFLIWFEIKSSILPSFTQCDLLKILKRCGSVNFGDWEGSFHDSNLFLFLRFIEHTVTGLSYFILFYFCMNWTFSLSTEHQLHAYGCVWISFWNDDEKLFHVHSERSRRKKEEWGSEKNGENFCGGSKKVSFYCSFLSFDKLTYSINIDGVSRCPLYG